MSKFYTIRSADGQRSYGSVTKVAAKGMVRRGEARFLPNCSVVQLTPPADPTDDKERQYKPRGISARPEAPLMHRYVLAKGSNGDPLAVAAIDVGWAPKDRPAPSQRTIQR
jgi:hypothetical protein